MPKHTYSIGILFIAATLVACPSGAKFPDPTSRAGSRTALMATATGVRVVAQACTATMETISEAGDDDKALELGYLCRGVIKPMMVVVSGAAQALDNWQAAPQDEAVFQKVACAAKSLAVGVQKLEAAGLVKNKALDDVLATVEVAATYAAPSCQVPAFAPDKPSSENE